MINNEHEDIETILNDFDELDNMPWWAEHLGINLLNWERRKLIKLYLIKQEGARKRIEELEGRLDDKCRIIAQSDTIRREQQKQISIERIRVRNLDRQLDEAYERIRELQQLLDEYKEGKPFIN
jgi:hypothetical protein